MPSSNNKALAKKLLRAELAFYDDGWSTILVNPGLKTPLGPWAESQRRRRTRNEIISDRKRHPLANIGLVCGAISGRTVIDLDGEEGIAVFYSQLHLPATRQHRTPSGGHHLVYQYNENFHTGANFLPKVDCRNDGGYIVAPSSIVNDIEYRVVDDRPPAQILNVPTCFLPRENPAPTLAQYSGPLPDDIPQMLEIIQQVAPRDYRTNADPRWRYQMPCPLPGHQGDWAGDGGSFYIDASQQFYKCFGCDQGPGSDGRGNAVKLYRLLFGIPFRYSGRNAFLRGFNAETAPEPTYVPTDDDNPFYQEEEYEHEFFTDPEWGLPQDYSQIEIGTCFIPSKQVGFRTWQQGAREYLDFKKAQFVAALPERTEAQQLRKRHIELCWDNYKMLKCQNTGERYLQRYRCGEPTCPICCEWLVENFFTNTGDDGRSKMDVLREKIVEPSLYLVHVFSFRFSPDPVEAQNQLAANEKRIKLSCKRFRQNNGEDWYLANSHFLGIRAKMEGDIIHYELAFGGNHARGGAGLLQAHFSHDFNLDCRVTEIVCHGVGNLKDRFVKLMALRCDWDTVQNYQLWRSATKGTKLIQGYGDFYNISGGTKPSRQLGMRMGECKVCGSCEPLDLGGCYPVANTRTASVVSEWTGVKYRVLIEEEYERAA